MSVAVSDPTYKPGDRLRLGERLALALHQRPERRAVPRPDGVLTVDRHPDGGRALRARGVPLVARGGALRAVRPLSGAVRADAPQHQPPEPLPPVVGVDEPVHPLGARPVLRRIAGDLLRAPRRDAPPREQPRRRPQLDASLPARQRPRLPELLPALLLRRPHRAHRLPGAQAPARPHGPHRGRRAPVLGRCGRAALRELARHARRSSSCRSSSLASR